MVIDAVVVEGGMRSATARPVPVAINTLPVSGTTIAAGCGEEEGAAGLVKRPFRVIGAYRKVTGTSAIDTGFSF